MNIIIADDEELIRLTLKSMLSELELPINVVGEASNGEELVKLARLHHPDAAFVDIRMPKMDGLKAIETLKEICPCTQWIILTGFSEFEYARQALRLGVASYLLKPVCPENLCDTLNEIFKKNKKYLIGLNKEFENDIIALFNDLMHQSLLDSQNIINSSFFMGGLFIIDSHYDETTRMQRQTNFCNSVYSLMNEYLNHRIRLAFLVLPSGEMATVGAWGFTRHDNNKGLVLNYFSELENICRKASCNDFSLTVLQSDACDSIDALQKQMDQLQNLASLRIIMDKNWRISLTDLVRQYKSSPKHMLEFTDIISKLSQYYKQKSYLDYIKSTDELERFVSRNKSFDYESIRSPLEKFLSRSIKCDFSDCCDIKSMIKKIRKNGEMILRHDSISSDIIDHVISFIEKNYMHDIGVAQIAKQLDITPNYLSSVFHKRTGETFMKYLTKVRMIKARELLSNPNVQVYQVAEQVGYYSPRYFAKLYKEYFGAYPSEHLKQHMC